MYYNTDGLDACFHIIGMLVPDSRDVRWLILVIGSLVPRVRLMLTRMKI